jgi:beta-lactamase regulating signal transducer with metallopeptidase domain
VLRVRRFHRLLRFAEPAPAWLRDEVVELASRLGSDRPPSVWLVPGRLSPMLWAMSGTPRLLLPAELLATLTAEQRATLLLHELAHYRRGDHWVRLLEMLTTGLYWWNPVVWWARAELREAEEQCCDAWVVWALPGAGRTYATALLECLDFLSDSRSPLPVGASGIGRLADLKRRLTMILSGKTPRRLTWAGCLAVLGLGLFFLPMWPSFAQQPDPSP